MFENINNMDNMIPNIYEINDNLLRCTDIWNYVNTLEIHWTDFIINIHSHKVNTIIIIIFPVTPVYIRRHKPNSLDRQYVDNKHVKRHTTNSLDRQYVDNKPSRDYHQQNYNIAARNSDNYCFCNLTAFVHKTQYLKQITMTAFQ